MTNEEIINAATAQMVAEAEQQAIGKAKSLLQAIAYEQSKIREANKRIEEFKASMKAIATDAPA